MAIKPLIPTIGINPTVQNATGFSTNLPSLDFTSGVQQFAQTLSQNAEVGLKTEAKKTAEEAARKVVISKDETGNYGIIKPPEDFGPYAQDVFDQAVEQNYINKVYFDTEATLNNIASDAMRSAESRYAEMNSVVSGVLKNVDPRFANQIGLVLQREVNQRQATMFNQQGAMGRDQFLKSSASSNDKLFTTYTRLAAISDSSVEALEQANEIRNKILRNQVDALTVAGASPEVIEIEKKKTDETLAGVLYLSGIMIPRIREFAINGGSLADIDDAIARFNPSYISANKSSPLADIFTEDFFQRTDAPSRELVLNAVKEIRNQFADKIKLEGSILDSEIKMNLDYAFNASMTNNTSTYNAYKSMTISSVRQKMGALTSDPQIIARAEQKYKDIFSGLEWFAPKFAEIKRDIEEAKVPPSEVNRLLKMLTPGMGEQGLAAFGISQTEIVNNITPEALPVISNLLEPLAKDYNLLFKQTDKEKRISALIDAFASNPNMDFIPPLNSQEDFSAAVVQTVPNLFTGDGVRQVSMKFNGVLPKDYIDFFRNSHQIDGETESGRKVLASKLEVYKAMKVLPTRTGDKDMTSMLASEDRVFFELMDSQLTGLSSSNIENNGPPIAMAAKIAREAIKKGVGVSKEESASILSNTYYAENNELGSRVKYLDAVDMQDAPYNAQEDALRNMALYSSQGLPWKKVKEIIKSEYERDYTTSDVVVSADGGVASNIIKKRYSLPLIKNPETQQMNSDYVAPYVNLMAESADRSIIDGFTKDKLEFGKNIKLEVRPSTTNIHSYYLLYTRDNHPAIRLKDANGNPLIFNPKEPAIKYNNWLQNEHAKEAIAKNEKRPYVKEKFNPDINDAKPSEIYQAVISKSYPKQMNEYVNLTNQYITEMAPNYADSLKSFLPKMMLAESKGSPTAKSPKSSAYGLGQMIDETWAIHGRGDRNDPKEQIKANIRLAISNLEEFRDNYIRMPTDKEQYIMWQQGANGGIALLRPHNADRSAYIVLTEANRNNSKRAMLSITNNLPERYQGLATTMTAKQFADIVMEMVRD